MKFTTGSYSSLLQGVSQQPPASRFEGQCSEQENMSSDAVRGLCRRPPAEFLFYLDAGWMNIGGHTDWRFQFLSILDGYYLVAYRKETIRVWNVFTGVEYPVTNTAASYLTDHRCSFATIGNTTYVANSGTTVQKLSTLYPDTRKGYIIIQVLGGAFSRNYRILGWKENNDYAFTPGPEIVYNTGNGVTAEDSNRLDVSAIAAQINAAAGVSATNYSWLARHAHVIGVPTGTPEYINLDVSDGSNNVNLVAYCGTSKSASRLPLNCVGGYTMRILGAESNANDDYYVEFEADTGHLLSPGIWRECTEPGMPYRLNSATMPHGLIFNESTNTFEFKQLAYEDRRAGDDLSNPFPSFVGSKIEDVASFQGRFVIVSGSTLVMSRTNKPLDFFANSATVVADSDPIDLESSIKQGVTLRRICLHNKDLVIFTSNAQLVLYGRSNITPANASLVVSTSFMSNMEVDPVETGSSIFFAVPFGEYTGVREFFTESASDANNSYSVTGHISEYLEGGARQLTASTNFDMLVVSTMKQDNAVYVFQYTTINGEKAQTAWSRWTLHGYPVYSFFIDSNLYVVILRNGKYSLCKIGIDRASDEGLDYQVHLDAKVEHPSVQVSLTVDEADKRVYVQGPGCPNPGMKVPIETITPDAVIFGRNMQGGTIISGFPYTSEYVPTRPFMRNQEGSPVIAADLKVRDFKVNFSASGDFVAQVEDQYDEPTVIHVSMREMGRPSNVIGQEAIRTSEISLPFRADPEITNLRIRCDEHTPLYITQLQWNGVLIYRASR